MSGNNHSRHHSGIDFLETDHEDRYMKEVFEHVEQVPDKEPTEEIPLDVHKVRKQKESPFSLLAGPDDQIDLHGKTREEAIMVVQNFVKTCHAQKLNHILIITGKGHHSGTDGPVLKTAVEQWLKKNGYSYIKEFQNAPSRFGGSGAVWIELK